MYHKSSVQRHTLVVVEVQCEEQAIRQNFVLPVIEAVAGQ